MKKLSPIPIFMLLTVLSCDVSSIGEDPCENFFVCNKGIFAGDGEEGGIIDRYVVEISNDLVSQTDHSSNADAFIIFYYKFEDHPSFDSCFHSSSFRKVEYKIDLNSENELAISNRATGIESTFVRNGDTIQWEYTEAIVTLHKSDIEPHELDLCGYRMF